MARVSLSLVKMVILLFCVAQASPALSRRLDSIPVDREFVTTPLGPPGGEGGKLVYAFIAMHKVINFEGSTYVCGLIFGGSQLNSRFFRFAKIIASDGTRLRTGLTRFPNTLTNAQFAERPELKRRRQAGRSLGVSRGVARNDIRQFEGQQASCVRSRKKWRDVFADGKSVFTMPSKVSVWVRE